MNNHARNGKIARLPKPIREELNLRLQAGATGRSITLWLNELSEVRTAMDAYFEGSAIREQNISEWKKGGYEEWLRHQEALEVVEYLYERGADLKAKATERMPVNEVLSLWLTSRYIVATKEIEALQGEGAWRKQRQLCDDLMKMRRAEHRTTQLELERERVDLKREEVKLQRERFEADLEFEPENDAEEESDPQSNTGDTPSGTHRPTKSRSRVRRGTNRCPSPPVMRHEPPTEEEMEARWRQILNIPFRPPGEKRPTAS